MERCKKFYLVGSNIKTSFSPSLHNMLFELKRKKDHQYLLYSENILPNLDELCNLNNFGGMSITIPFKQTYYKQKHNIQSTVLKYEGQFARKTKIINTVVKIDDSLFQAYNTDLFGIEKTLNPVGDMDKVVILGAGATSQTFCEFFQKNSQCSQIFILNRSPTKIEQLSKKYNKVKMFSKHQNQKIGLLVNTLPSQIINQNQDEYNMALNQLFFTNHPSFMDVNYRTKQKILENVIQAKRFNLKCFSGLDMLIWQAIQQNRFFCQQDPEDEILQKEYHQILKKEISRAQVIK